MTQSIMSEFSSIAEHNIKKNGSFLSSDERLAEKGMMTRGRYGMAAACGANEHDDGINNSNIA